MIGLNKKQYIVSAVAIVILATVGIGIAKKDVVVPAVSDQIDSAKSLMTFSSEDTQAIDEALVAITAMSEELDTETYPVQLLSASDDNGPLTPVNICINWLIANAEYIKDKGYALQIPDFPGMYESICVTPLKQ